MVSGRCASLLALAIAACGGEPKAAKAPTGGIERVEIVMRNDEPLPFDPRGGRLTLITQELTRLLGHPLTLELDASLSPALRASLEESLIASFEQLVKDLVFLRREEPEVFDKGARALERIVCRYDAVAERSRGRIEDGGKTLRVDAPADRFPLLERGVVTATLFEAYLGDLEARYGEVDPARVPAEERTAYFAYLTRTRPGYGYLYVHHRRSKVKDAPPDLDLWATYRYELVGKALRLASVLERDAPLERDVRAFLLESAPFVGEVRDGRGRRPDPKVRDEVVARYARWLSERAPSLGDDERLVLARAVLENRTSMCGRDCPPDAVLPGFDAFAFAMGIVDAWARAGAPVELGDEPRAKLWKAVVCPARRSPEGSTEIRYGCGSRFFERAIRDEAWRERLAQALLARRDPRLVENALLNLGHGDGPAALDLVERLARDEGLFRRGVSVLLEDFARQDHVRRALEEAAPRWWRDPQRRGIVLYVNARRWAGLHPHYADDQWTRFAAEFGGPIPRDTFAAYLAQGPRAVELAPQLWPALARGSHRAELVAGELPRLLARDHEARTDRAQTMLSGLRKRLCAERDATGMRAVRAQVERWSREHTEERAALANALSDLDLARCPTAATGE